MTVPINIWTSSYRIYSCPRGGVYNHIMTPSTRKLRNTRRLNQAFLICESSQNYSFPVESDRKEWLISPWHWFPSTYPDTADDGQPPQKFKIFWVVCKVTADSLLWTRTKPITKGTCPQTASMQSFHYPWEFTNRRMRLLAELKYTHSFADSKRQMEGWLYDPCINTRLVYLGKILVYW